MDLSSMDDAAILALLAGLAGRRTQDAALSSAIGALYDRYGRLVYSIAINIVRENETAEEIVQDVFVRVWENAATYRPEVAKVSSWLASITRNRAIDELRKRNVRPEKDRTDWPEDIGMDTMTGLPAPDRLEESVEGSIRREGIRQMITSLPEDQRRVLSLAYIHGLTHSQIAEILGEPLGTVKSRVRLAMQKMRDALVERGMTDVD